MIKKNLEKIKELLQKTPRALAENTFFSLAGLFLAALILGSLVFYQYVFLVQKAKPEIDASPPQLEEKTYQNVLQIWTERENEFKEISSKKYPDPFYSATSTNLTK